MNNDKQKRLKLVVTLLGLTNLEIAQKTSYTPTRTSEILNKPGVEVANKFIMAFCAAFPKANKNYIIDAQGLPLIGEDLSAYGFNQPNIEVNSLKEKLNLLAD
jgi:hypothetical protein